MNKQRREFIIGAGRGMLMLSALPYLQGCDDVTRDPAPTAAENEKIANLLGADLSAVIYLASLAPSGHNTQPWVIKVSTPHDWIIGSENTRWLPAVDPNNHELLLSIGAFLENLVTAANHYGYQVNYRVIARSPHDAELLHVQLQKDKPVTFELDKIAKRRTLRNGYLQRELTVQDFTYITDGAPDIHYIPKDSKSANYLADGTLEANRTQASRDAAQEELANWIRWSSKDAAKYRNGLTSASMEIEGAAGWYVQHFFKRDSVLKQSFRKTGVEKVAQQVRQGAGWLVMTSNGADISALLETGRKFERMLLKLRDKMIAVHPMTQMLEEEPWRSDVSKKLGLNQPVRFILRTGYRSSYPDPVSLRMPPSWFVTNTLTK